MPQCRVERSSVWGRSWVSSSATGKWVINVKIMEGKFRWDRSKSEDSQGEIFFLWREKFKHLFIQPNSTYLIQYLQKNCVFNTTINPKQTDEFANSRGSWDQNKPKICRAKDSFQHIIIWVPNSPTPLPFPRIDNGPYSKTPIRLQELLGFIFHQSYSRGSCSKFAHFKPQIHAHWSLRCKNELISYIFLFCFALSHIYFP